jgi:hypothetical protein
LDPRQTVTEDITTAMNEENDLVHADLAQVWIHTFIDVYIHCQIGQAVKVWFQNKAQGVVEGTGAPSVNPRHEKRGHPTSSKPWTAKTVCGSIFSICVDNEQCCLSGTTGSKDIGKYTPALGLVFEALSTDEMAKCESLAEEWNTAELPDEVLRKWIHCIYDPSNC